MGEDYLRLLASFEKLLALEHRSDLLDPAMAIKVLSLSEGTIGEISALLCRAAIAAIENGTERITIASLERCGYIAPSDGAQACGDRRTVKRARPMVNPSPSTRGPLGFVILAFDAKYRS
jgi:hypothetical protein